MRRILILAALTLSAPALAAAQESASAQTLTLRGGVLDAPDLSQFTPRLDLEGPAPFVASGFGTNGFGMGGFEERPGATLGAAVDLGTFSIGGALGFGEGEEADGAALGLSWSAAPGVSLGGALGVTTPRGEPAPGFSAGVSLDLDF